MVYTVVIADDITGANDIGVMYALAGLDAVVYSYDKIGKDFVPSHEVTIIDTNSRFCSREEAYNRVYQITRQIGKSSAVQFVDKQCSVFRGNIGAEFDAMLDALEEEHGMVILGFPDNGRTTVNGNHYVHGVLLEESQFRTDPVHPMTQSNLVDILQGQTQRKVALIPYTVIEQGVDAIKKEKEKQKKEASYLIFDVRDNKDLEILALALQDEKIICGSSAPGFYLGTLYAKSKGILCSKEDSLETKDKILGIAGSLTPQTKAQTAYIKKAGYPVITLDTYRLFDETEKQQEEERILMEYEKCWQNSRLVLIHSLQEETQVARTKELATQAGISNTEVSELVSKELAKLAKIIGEKYEIKKYIICGGDTSASFCNEMEIMGLKVLHEIEAGLPTCKSITSPFYELVLKSGSFGKEAFIESAMKFL